MKIPSFLQGFTVGFALVLTAGSARSAVLVSNFAYFDINAGFDHFGWDNANLSEYPVGQRVEPFGGPSLLESVSMFLDPSGPGVSVSICADSSGGLNPGGPLVALSGPTSISTYGFYTYTLPAPLAIGGDPFWVVFRANPGTGRVRVTNSVNQVGLSGYALSDSSAYYNTTTSQWSTVSQPVTISLDGTVVPEPAGAALLVAGALSLSVRRRR